MISFKIKHFYQHFDQGNISLSPPSFFFSFYHLFHLKRRLSLSFNLNKNEERFYCSFFFLNLYLMVQQDHHQYSVGKSVYHGREKSSSIWLSVTFIDSLLYAGVFWILSDSELCWMKWDANPAIMMAYGRKGVWQKPQTNLDIIWGICQDIGKAQRADI